MPLLELRTGSIVLETALGAGADDGVSLALPADIKLLFRMWMMKRSKKNARWDSREIDEIDDIHEIDEVSISMDAFLSSFIC